MDYQTQKDHYENLWKKVGLWKNESSHYKTRVPQQETLDFIKFLKENNVKGKALDIGCGGGRHVIAFAKAGFDSYGIDFSKTAIKLAKLDAEDKHIKVNLKVGNVMNMPYKQDFFDIVHDSGCLHHIKKSDWQIYLKNILKVLKKGGYYKLFSFSKKTKFLTGKKISKTKPWIINKGHYSYFFSKKEIKNTFSKQFKIIKIIDEKRKNNQRAFYIIYMRKK